MFILLNHAKCSITINGSIRKSGQRLAMRYDMINCSATNSWYDLRCVILNVTVSVPSPHPVPLIQKMKNNHWLTVTKILQPSRSAFVKLEQKVCKEPSRTLIWWLDVLFPQTANSLGQGLLREAIQYNGKRTGFDVECICIWISAPHLLVVLPWTTLLIEEIIKSASRGGLRINWDNVCRALGMVLGTWHGSPAGGSVGPLQHHAIMAAELVCAA